MNETTPTSQLVRKRQLAKLMSVSPRTVDGWVAKRMIPFIEPNPRLHLFDPIAVKSALMAQFAVPANMAAERQCMLEITESSAKAQYAPHTA